MTGQGPVTVLTAEYKYRLNGPVFGDAAVMAAASLLKDPDSFGAVVGRFEAGFAERFGLSSVSAVTNATVAYYTILKYLGIGPGDSVLVPAYTFVSAANIPALLGAEPVFCDTAADCPCISIEDVRRKHDSSVKALLYVSSFGYSRNMMEIRDYCSENGITMIHDAASSAGTLLGGREILAIGDYGFTSLHYKKVLSSFEGGLLWGRDGDEFFRSFRNHGKVDDYEYPGMNFRLSDLHAVLGLEQIGNLDARLELRRRLFAEYGEGLKGVKAVEVPEFGPETIPAVHQMIIFTDDRTGLAAHLKKNGAETGAPAQFIPGLPYFSRKDAGPFPNSERYAARALALPFHEGLTFDDIGDVCRMIRNYFE